MKLEFLPPEKGKPLVRAVADWLWEKRIPCAGASAAAFDHLLVVVPTRQAGRRLAFALVEKARARTGIAACIPPIFKTPSALLSPEETPAENHTATTAAATTTAASDATTARATGVAATATRAAAATHTATHTTARAATPAESNALLASLLASGGALARENFPAIFPQKPGGENTAAAALSFPGALGIARQLHDLWGILADGALNFRAVAEKLPPDHADAARWRELASLETLFLETLAAHHLRHADASLAGLIQNPRLPDDCLAAAGAAIHEIILAAHPGATPALCDLLKNLAANTGLKLTILVHAREQERGLFDAFGRPQAFTALPGARPLGSAAHKLPLDDERQIELASDAEQQARAAAGFVAACLDGSGAAPQKTVALGNADPEIFDHLAAAFLARGVTLRNPASFPVRATALGRLAAQTLALCHLRENAPASLLSAFLRGADVRAWLAGKHIRAAAVLDEFDQLQNAHLPRTFADVSRHAARAAARRSAKNQKRSALAPALDAIRSLAGIGNGGTFAATTATATATPSAASSPSAAAVSASAATATAALPARVEKALAEIFANFSPDEKIPGHRELAAAAEKVSEILKEFSDSKLLRAILTAAADTRATAHAAAATTARPAAESEDRAAALLATLLENAAFSLEPDAPRTLAAEGWVELAWAPEDALVVTGLNEGCVPETVTAHAFLPDSLRSTLGLPCNDTRLARDWLLLRSMLAARAPENVRLLLARVNTRADALKPSRLLFTGTGDGDAADKLFAARAARLFKDAAPPAPAPPRSLPAAWRLALPLPGDGPAAGFFAARPEKSRHGLPAVSVTALKDYIACPFAFFLKHVLQMETVDYRAAELDESAFGRLAHEVLEAFAQSPAARSGDAGEISRFLHEKTDALFAKNFGAELAAVLLLQREELKKRLGFFARQQAAAAAAGWEIIAAERHFTLPFPAHGFEIHGKIDRVDRNQNTGCFRILDYKTWDKKKDAGEGVYDPGKTALDNAAGRRCPRLVVPPATPKGRPKSAAWADLQLPLYLRAAQTGAVRKAPDSDAGTGSTGSTGDDGARLVPEGADIACAHFALGRSEEVSGLSDYDQRLFRDPSIDGTLDALLSRLAAGIFWPPLKRKYPPLEPFKPLFLGLSEEEIAASISEPWIADQNRRIANWDAARAARQEEPA